MSALAAGLEYVVKAKEEDKNGGKRQSANRPCYGHDNVLQSDAHEFGRCVLRRCNDSDNKKRGIAATHAEH